MRFTALHGLWNVRVIDRCGKVESDSKETVPPQRPGEPVADIQRDGEKHVLQALLLTGDLGIVSIPTAHASLGEAEHQYK